MNDIIVRLRRNAKKQKEYRHIVRGRIAGASYEMAKRKADAFFLRHYAHLSLGKVAVLVGLSPERVRQIENMNLHRTQFTICHPNKSCM